MTPEARIAALEAENAALHEQVETLAAQLQELQAELARDSCTSRKPPSNDGLRRKAAKTKSLCQKRGKKPDGRAGYQGGALQVVVLSDAVEEHHPGVYAHY